MSTLADLFLCPAAEMEQVDLTRSPLKELDGPYDGVAFRRLADLHFEMLWAQLEGADWGAKLHRAELVRRTSDESEDWGMVVRFPQRMVTTFAHADDAAIGTAAHQLVETEDFHGWQPDDLVAVMNEVRKLARQAGGRELCLWLAL
jgi:hypothetical protein